MAASWRWSLCAILADVVNRLCGESWLGPGRGDYDGAIDQLAASEMKGWVG